MITDALWKCDNCGHEMMIYISQFVSSCPKCSQEYIHLGTLWGFHMHHEIPLYVKKGDSNVGFKMAELIALTRAREPPTFVCHDRDFYETIRLLQIMGKIDERSKLIYSENKDYKP